MTSTGRGLSQSDCLTLLQWLVLAAVKRSGIRKCPKYCTQGICLGDPPEYGDEFHRRYRTGLGTLPLLASVSNCTNAVAVCYTASHRL